MQQLNDGTSNLMRHLAFSATLADYEVIHYGEAMKQPGRASKKLRILLTQEYENYAESLRLEVAVR
jgi:hypothetical protein